MISSVFSNEMEDVLLPLLVIARCFMFHAWLRMPHNLPVALASYGYYRLLGPMALGTECLTNSFKGFPKSSVKQFLKSQGCYNPPANYVICQLVNLIGQRVALCTHSQITLNTDPPTNSALDLSVKAPLQGWSVGSKNQFYHTFLAPPKLSGRAGKPPGASL